MNEKNEVVKEFIGGGSKEKLIPLMKEAYEEALKIVETTSRPNQKRRPYFLLLFYKFP